MNRSKKLCVLLGILAAVCGATLIVLQVEERQEKIRKSTEYYNKNAKPGSMMSKANMVRQYNEKNNKK